jgi:hypothetical protein
MLVRLTRPVTVGETRRRPGELWDLPVDEAAALIEDGSAVPASRDLVEHETAATQAPVFIPRRMPLGV